MKLKFKPLRKNLWVDFGQIKEFVLFLQFFASFRAFEIWKSDFQRADLGDPTSTMSSASPSAVALASALRPAVQG